MAGTYNTLSEKHLYVIIVFFPFVIPFCFNKRRRKSFPFHYGLSLPILLQFLFVYFLVARQAFCFSLFSASHFFFVLVLCVKYDIDRSANTQKKAAAECVNSFKGKNFMSACMYKWVAVHHSMIWGFLGRTRAQRKSFEIWAFKWIPLQFRNFTFKFSFFLAFHDSVHLNHKFI